eukprot:g15578.t1
MTPHSIPTALGALYVAEIRLAFKAMKEERWDELWRPTNGEVKMPLPPTAPPVGKQAPLHVMLKNGKLVVGKLEKVLQCPNAQKQVLHRRDQSTELELRPCTLLKDRRSESIKCVLTDKTLQGTQPLPPRPT